LVILAFTVRTSALDIGRIFKLRAGVPDGFPWMWRITGAVVALHLPSHGFCASLEEAKVKFARDVARLAGSS